MFRKVLLIAAAMMAVTGYANAESNGSVSAGYSSNDMTSVDLDTTSFGGAVYFGFANGFGLQGDALYKQIDAGAFDDDYLQYDLHGLYRTDAWAAGLVVGSSKYYNNDLDIYGVEGAAYLSRFTLGASYLHGDADLGQDLDRLGVEGRYFITDNFALGAGYGHTEYDTSVLDTDFDSFDVNAEYRFSAFPIAVSLGYGKSDFDTQRDVDGWRFGLRWDIGTASLIDRDRHGASFDDVDAFTLENYRLD